MITDINIMIYYKYHPVFLQEFHLACGISLFQIGNMYIKRILQQQTIKNLRSVHTLQFFFLGLK